jgi:hypothetical protein
VVVSDVPQQTASGSDVLARDKAAITQVYAPGRRSGLTRSRKGLDGLLTLIAHAFEGAQVDIEFNDAGLLDTQGTGWFLGYSDWVKPSATGMTALRHMPKDLRSHTLCMKWMHHRKGDPLGTDKPRSEGRAMSIMVSAHGHFRLQFSEDPQFPPAATVEHVMRGHGQFSVWGAGIYHRWYVDEDCTILTLRWTPEEDASTSGP